MCWSFLNKVVSRLSVRAASQTKRTRYVSVELPSCSVSYERATEDCSSSTRLLVDWPAAKGAIHPEDENGGCAPQRHRVLLRPRRYVPCNIHMTFIRDTPSCRSEVGGEHQTRHY